MTDLVQIRAPAVASASGTDVATPRKRVHIRTFGCQMNEYDSAKLLKILDKEFDPVDSPESADLVIVNTCSVRDKPEQKLYSMLGQLRDLKREKPGLMIGVGGCVAQQEGKAIVQRNRAVDFVFGTHNLSLVPALLERRRDGGAPQVAVDYRDEWEELPLGLSAVAGGRVSTFVSISRGCNKNCTYCIVPTTRGAEVSRNPEEIEREVRIAAHRGAREIVLLGQTVNSYGRDLTPRLSFVGLLERLARIGGVERLRFTSPHPQEVRQDFIDLVTQNPKVCRHIHMPLQSGSDRILKAMNRNYRRKRYLEIIEALVERVPDMAITTDLIVGFPGETEEDFRETLDVIRRVRFQDSYSFMFSPRPGTVAAAMEDDVPAEEKLRRLSELQQLQERITAERLEAWRGKEIEILLDGPSQADPACMRGRSSQNITVNLIDPNPLLVPGAFVRAEVTEPSRFTLRARYIEAFPRSASTA